MNYKIVELKSVQSYLVSIVEELGEKRAVNPSEETPVAWAMKAHIILDGVMGQMRQEDLRESAALNEKGTRKHERRH